MLQISFSIARLLESDNMVARESYPSPLQRSGTLDNTFAFEEATPVIGREYPTINIVDDILNASNADELIRDLAITSQYMHPRAFSLTNYCKSPNEVLYFSEPKTISQMLFRSNLSTALAN